jgi:hypothetical protein
MCHAFLTAELVGGRFAAREREIGHIQLKPRLVVFVAVLKNNDGYGKKTDAKRKTPCLLVSKNYTD